MEAAALSVSASQSHPVLRAAASAHADWLAGERRVGEEGGGRGKSAGVLIALGSRHPRSAR